MIKINIGCYLISDGERKEAFIAEKMLLELVKSLRNNGKEWVHFKDNSIEVEGIYIPAKGSKTGLIILPNEE